MNKIILTKGLPASGKTTFARELLKKEPGKWKRINKDDLRAMLDNGVWSKANEKFIIQARDWLVVNALENKFNVIVDDTNLASKHEASMREYAKLCGAEVEIADFTDVPLEECIKRDQKRANYVGEKVIRQMYNQFLKPKPETPICNATDPQAIICDIDGTLALFGDANPYDRDFMQDKINMPVRGIVTLYNKYHQVILLSGRMDKYREVTEAWLKANKVPYDHLFMRKSEDVRKDSIIKKELYEENINGKYNVRFVLDDRNQVVDMWRSLGLTCLQVAPGDF